MAKLRPRQKKDLQSVQDLLIHEDKVILACSTGYGKTVVSWEFVKQAVANNKRVLVLTHGRKEIRDNFVESVAADTNYLAFEDPQDAEYASKAPVVVALPQSIAHHVDDLGSFDYLVCDEAHHYYKADMVQQIISELKIQKHLLLTNTHYELNYPKVFCSREALLQDGLIEDIRLSVVPTNFDVNFYKDFMNNGNLKNANTVPRGLITALRKLITDTKTMVMTHSMVSANLIHKSLSHDFDCEVSTHENDPQCLKLSQFKNTDLHILIVVDRGVIGFDYPDLGCIIDVTFSRNVELLDQIFGRLCRKPTRKISKVYFKLVPKYHLDEFLVIMSGVLALGLDDIYPVWDGRDTNLRIVDKKWLKSGDHVSLEDSRFYSKYITSFSDYCSIYNTDKTKKHSIIRLSTALKKIRTRTPWLSYEGAKDIAFQFDDIADWRKRHRLSHNYAYDKKWIKDIAQELGWDYEDPWLYEDCVIDAEACIGLEQWSRTYPDSYGFAAQQNWLGYIREDRGWV